MMQLITTAQFRRDYKLCKKRGLSLALLETVIQMLLEQTPLPDKYRDHALTGNYAGFRECHIQPDWLLVYRADKNALILTAVRTGTHADLLNM